MNLAQAMQQIVPPIQTLKQRSLHQPGGETTMSPSLIALRDDRVIATVTAPRLQAVVSCAQTFAIGLAPQMLVIAAQVNLPAREVRDELAAQEEGEGIAYTLFTADKEASLAVQRYAVRDGQVVFSPPERGRPDDRTLMDELAKAMSQEPLDPAKVARKDEAAAAASAGQDAAPNFIPVAQGRIAIDAGTVKAAYGKVQGIGGTALYVAADGAEATRMLAAGLPQECLLS
ncbi:hypothetical protein [Ornithinimicrobium cryptoxanthini]|uniref:Uncharacterized protein n=1 Tax=Ornithinimicrobium cryptoxanthini TaxID=2934161 RepID=A0ABY4YKX6_9MICO|nr:hypothetical protein [Ornithinimicrobium cryptoxanthini]USQ77211.1 hypothetical protein NF557_04670 [Ornithinimicrobium cryptoxanthini]